jgi:hypothetical protein
MNFLICQIKFLKKKVIWINVRFFEQKKTNLFFFSTLTNFIQDIKFY